MLKHLNPVHFHALLHVILCEPLYSQNRFIYPHLHNTYIQYKSFNAISLVFANLINKPVQLEPFNELLTGAHHIPAMPEPV